MSGSSSGTQPAKWLTRGSGAAQASHPRQRIDAFQRSADFYQLDPSHSRRLMQNAPTPAPASATGAALSSLHACLPSKVHCICCSSRELGAVEVQHHTPDLIHRSTHCNHSILPSMLPRPVLSSQCHLSV